MGVLEIFDYVYYRIYAYYIRFKSERASAGLTSTLVLSLMQSFNLLTFFLLYELFTGIELKEAGIYGYHFVLVAMGVLVLNIVRYLVPKRIFPLVEKWGQEEMEVRKKKGYRIVAYIIISAIAFIGLAGILGGSK